jgi:hypothetical protein
VFRPHDEPRHGERHQRGIGPLAGVEAAVEGDRDADGHRDVGGRGGRGGRGVARARARRGEARQARREEEGRDAGERAHGHPTARVASRREARRAIGSGAMTLTPADLRALRADFPALDRRRNGKPPVYLNNTCMTLRPRAVIDAVTRYYTDFPTCGGGRSEGARKLHSWFAEELQAEEAAAREALARLVNAARPDELVWTRNATEALNIVAHGFPLEPGDRVLLSEREHNSNLVPWL